MPNDENTTPAPDPQPGPSDAEVIQALIGTETRGRDVGVTEMVNRLSDESVFKGRTSGGYERRDS